MLTEVGGALHSNKVFRGDPNIIWAIFNGAAIVKGDFRKPSYLVLGVNSRENTGGYLH